MDILSLLNEAEAAGLAVNELVIAQTTAKRVITETARIAFVDPLEIYDDEEYERSGKLVFKSLKSIPK